VPFIVVPVFLALIHYRFVLREEPFMAERFGEAYDAYRTRVRRWLQRRRSMMPRDPGDNYAATLLGKRSAPISSRLPSRRDPCPIRQTVPLGPLDCPSHR
jgi:hypothetical protein